MPATEQASALQHLIDELRGHIEFLEETNRAHLEEIRLLRTQLASRT